MTQQEKVVATYQVLEPHAALSDSAHFEEVRSLLQREAALGVSVTVEDLMVMNAELLKSVRGARCSVGTASRRRCATWRSGARG